MSQLRLPPTTDSVPVARRHARHELRQSAADVDTVVLLVSEVVTNAILHARSDVYLEVLDRGDVARVEVRDSSPMPPRLHRFAVDSATGRGMRLLDQLSLRWGAERADDVRGKIVWFEVGAPGEAAWQSFGDFLLAEGAAGEV